MSETQTTEEKLRESQYANITLLIMLAAVIIGFLTSANIGIIAFFIGLFMAHVFNEQKQDRERAFNKRIDLFSMGARLSLRKIYFGTDDEEIKSEVKHVAMTTPFIYGWASLYLDLTDYEFRSKCESEGEGMIYIEAITKIETDGPPLLLEGKKIIGMQPKW